MRTTSITLGSAFLASAFLGCGPMQAPMPPRLDEAAQKSADESWNNAFTPVDKLDHQTLLDAFLITQAYQVGVDRLTMRSEKRIDKGLLVMEIHFDRAAPNDDRFEVSIFDDNNQRVRHDLYTRTEVEQTYRELFPDLPPPGAVNPEPPQWVQMRESARKRHEAVANLLPRVEAKQPGP